MKKYSMPRIIIALTFIIFGWALFLTVLGYIDPRFWTAFWKYAPIIFFVIAFTELLRKRYYSAITLVFWGSLFLASTLIGWWIWTKIWPLLIVWVGISLLIDRRTFKKFEKWQRYVPKGGVIDSDEINDSYLFQEYKFKVKSSSFRGGKIDTVFGGTHLDLSKVELDKDGAELEINAVFCSAVVLVSDNYRVESKGVGLLGSWINLQKQGDKKSPLLRITGAAVFGTVEIRG